MEFDSSTLGYILDLISGIFIISSIIFRSKRDIKVESETFFDGNPFVYASQLRASIDGLIGLTLLLLATIMHIYHFELGFEVFKSILIRIFALLCLLVIIKKIAIEKEVKKRYPHYDLLKKEKEKGTYDTYPSKP